MRQATDESRPAGEVRANRLIVATIEPMHGNELVVYTQGRSGRS